MKPTRIAFQGQAANFAWAPVYVEVASREQFEKLCIVDFKSKSAPVEQRTRWCHNNELTGVMLNFCRTPGCRVCGGEKQP